MKLKISDTLSLPDNAATQKIAFIGRTGSGKSNGAGVLVEKLLHAEQQVVVLDPVGIWYGLRTNADGTPGFPIPIFGGLHGDIPLEPTGGALVADLIVDRGISVILDVSQFESDADKSRFAANFADRFFFRKKASPSAVHLVIEECQEFIPQNLQRGEERMLHAFQRMWKLGRNFGIGGSLITQRPQEVSKKALNQTELVFAFQTTGPQERKALELWMTEKGGDSTLAADLPALKVGQCFAWSPQWLAFSGKITFYLKETFNSSSTPLVGSRSTRLNLAPVDLTDLQEKMKETVERAKADDPKLLRAEIHKLTKELNRLQNAVPEVPAPVPPVEVEILSPQNLRTLESLRENLEDVKALVQSVGTGVFELNNTIVARTAKRYNAPARTFLEQLSSSQTDPVQAKITREVKSIIETSREPGHRGTAKSGLRRMLTAIAQRPGINRRQLGIRAGLSSTSGSFNTYLSAMRKNRWLDEQYAEGFYLSAGGTAALGKYTPLPVGPELLDYWCEELGNSGASRMLRALQNTGSGYTREHLGAVIGMSHTSGSFNTYLSKLRSLELIEGREKITLSEELR